MLLINGCTGNSSVLSDGNQDTVADLGQTENVLPDASILDESRPLDMPGDRSMPETISHDGPSFDAPQTKPILLAKMLGAVDLRGIALDDTYVYWTNFVEGTGSTPIVVATPKVGGNPYSYFPLLLSGGSGSLDTWALGIAADGAALYWTHGSADGRVLRGGFGMGVPKVISDTEKEDHPYAVAVNKKKEVFWLTGNAVKKYDPVSQEVKILATNSLPLTSWWHPFALAVDDDFVYWVDSSNDSVMRVKTDGTGLLTLVSDQPAPQGLCVDDLANGYVYFSVRGTYSLGNQDGGIRRVLKTGGNAISLMTGESGPMAVAVDKSFVYWSRWGKAGTKSGAVRKMSLGGGNYFDIASGLSTPYSLAVDATRVYWVDYDVVMAAPK
ncbi:MAG: hypothetical protein V1754_07120 [Pseudomonadota bacterium]